MTSRLGRLALAALAIAGGLTVSAVAHHRALEVLGFATFVAGAIAISFVWAADFARADHIEHVVGTPDGATVVIEDRITTLAHGDASHVDRLTARRLRDGVRLAHVGNEPNLRLLGAARDGVWCSSSAMAVHVRDPATLAVIHDERAVLGTSGITLKRVTRELDPEDPVFDPGSGGVHAFAGDGRGYLISPDLSIAEAPRAQPRPLRTEPTKIRLPTPAAQERWRTTVPADVLARVTHTLVTPARVLLVVGPTPSTMVGSGRGRHSVGGTEGHVAIAIDTATGDVVWRAKL